MVNSFCCFRLHTAAVIIGWLGAAASLFNIVTYIVIIAKLDNFVNWINGTNATVTNSTNDEIIENAEQIKTIVLIIICIYLVLHIVNCASSILLIAGAIKERHLMIVPWLLNSGIALGYQFINFFGVMIYFIVNGFEFSTIILALMIGSVVLGIQFYIWTAMHSLYRLMRNSSEQQRLIRPTSTAYPSYTKI